MSLPKNLPASVKARLLNLAQSRNETFNDLVVRYCIERLLYRLGQSKHADRFLLKGAMLFVLWDGRVPRPTKDVDFLGFGRMEVEAVAGAIREIVASPVTPDGLEFDAETVIAEEIREGQAYGGIRAHLVAYLGKARIPLQIDVGSGDAVTPGPEEADFPTLLDFPAPRVLAYPVYTVVAEKFEAMVKLGITNTRMKDFYDLWFLSRRFPFEGATLQKAIHATLMRRQTVLSRGFPYPLTDAFARDEAKQIQWAGFLRRNGLAGSSLTFAEIVVLLRQFIGPALSAGKIMRHWHPGTGWHE